MVSSRAKKAKSESGNDQMEMPAKVLQALKKFGGIVDEAAGADASADEDGQAVVLEEVDSAELKNEPVPKPASNPRQARRMKAKRSQAQQRGSRRNAREHRSAGFAKQGQG